jgi:hypothetical protein
MVKNVDATVDVKFNQSSLTWNINKKKLLYNIITKLLLTNGI